MPHPASLADDIIIARQGSAGLIRLNRPAAINSLNHAMVSGMKAGLDAFLRNPEVICVILSGEGERGLCAGGDVRQIHATRTESEADRSRFWREEFPLNHTISRYSKPYVALMDGIVMGGGVGISAHGQYRIVTERTRLAMPETAIGYFPDVGATWLLPQAPGQAGTWLGLTGREIGAADAIHMGLADYHVAAEQLDDLVQALGDVYAAADVGAVIERFASAPKVDGIVARHRGHIDAAFGFDTVEQIFEARHLSMMISHARRSPLSRHGRQPVSSSPCACCGRGGKARVLSNVWSANSWQVARCCATMISMRVCAQHSSTRTANRCGVLPHWARSARRSWIDISWRASRRSSPTIVFDGHRNIRSNIHRDAVKLSRMTC